MRASQSELLIEHLACLMYSSKNSEQMRSNMRRTIKASRSRSTHYSNEYHMLVLLFASNSSLEQTFDASLRALSLNGQGVVCTAWNSNGDRSMEFPSHQIKSNQIMNQTDPFHVDMGDQKRGSASRDAKRPRQRGTRKEARERSAELG
jgi:hypothetical protein